MKKFDLKSFLAGIIVAGIVLLATGAAKPASPIKEYKVVKGSSHSSISQAVNREIKNNWRPLGAPFAIDKDDYAQALVR